MLDVEINDISETFDVYLTSLILKCKFFEKPYEYDSIKKEGKLRILVKEKVNKIERLKEEVNNDEDELLVGETKKFKLLTDSKYEKKDTLQNIAVLESKLIKLITGTNC